MALEGFGGLRSKGWGFEDTAPEAQRQRKILRRRETESMPDQEHP